jgi:hypothetical protein
MTGALEATPAEGDFDSSGADSEDPHAGLYAMDEAEGGGYAPAESDVGMCPRDTDLDNDTFSEGGDDPHAPARLFAADVPPPTAAIPRSTASNGHSIVEIYADRAKLAGHTLRVRGVVVKRTDGILGKTFLHLRDGTGSAEHEDDDLTATTTEDVALGDTVELEGQLLVDQDLGLGYRYDALLDTATRIASR